MEYKEALLSMRVNAKS